MHEMSTTQGVLEIIDENIKNYNLKKVNKVVLEIGEDSCIEENNLKFSFEAVSKGTICENAQLIIKKIPGEEIIVEMIEGE